LVGSVRIEADLRFHRDGVVEVKEHRGQAARGASALTGIRRGVKRALEVDRNMLA
jgi:hypothetical protein